MNYLTPHQEKALDYNNHISLTANAGSGKTFVLSKRFLKIITNENISLRNIAAITFTDKAASELYKKIAFQIEDEIKASADEKEIRKLENLRRQLVSASISTIHSFCIDILREHPVEAGLDANFTPVDEITSGELIELSVEEMIKDSLNDKDDEEKLKNLIRVYSSKSLLSKEIISLIKNRKNVLAAAGKIYYKEAKDIATFFHESFIENFEKIFLPKIGNVISSLSVLNEAVSNENPDNQIAPEIRERIPKLNYESASEDLIKKLNEIGSLALTNSNKIKTAGYLKKKLRNSYLKEIDTAERFFEDFAKLELIPDYNQVEYELAHFGKALIYFFNKALNLYNKKKKENSCLDYEDILLHTKNILELENIRKDLSAKYKYIMIDEYQDTNEIQYNIFLPILEMLKTGNLFIVGDEKQSIYMFRDAELEVFDITKNDIKSASGSKYLLTLPDSFRMTPAICLFTNLLFKKLFTDPDLLFNEVEHSDLICARSDNKPGQIEILLAEKNETEISASGIHLINSEAEIVAKRILKLIQDNKNKKELTWNNVAVLCRKRKYFNDLEKAFVKYNIPFVIVGGKGFYQKQTVYDIYNYFSFLADRQNDTALIGILRSPFFSISDSRIFEISLMQGRTYWEKLQQFVMDNIEFNYIVELLKENLSIAKSYNVTALLRKILNESNLLAVLSAKPNGKQEIANIEKLIKLSINFFSQSFKTLYDYVVFLRDSIEQFEDEAQAAVAEESNSVKIMTYHQSKGLEYDAVFLYSCNESLKKESIKAKSVTVNKKFGLLTKVPLNADYSSEYNAAPIIGMSNLITEKKNLAEFKRLFYVGITRAKDYLFISAAVDKDKKCNANSFLSFLHDGLDIDFNSESITIKSLQKFLLFENDKFNTIDKEFSTEIKILNDVETLPVHRIDENETNNNKTFKIKGIKDYPKGEIISATKISVYKQCPLKYHLTYDLGFAPLFRDYKKWTLHTKSGNKYEFNEREDAELFGLNEIPDYKNISELADVKGRIIHAVLQKEVSQNQFDDFIDGLIKQEISVFNIDKKQITDFKGDIIADLKNFYSSREFFELTKYRTYYNEYEIYTKERDYFLYGIIDKLIIDGNKAIIVDYKTDSVTEKELEEKSINYFNQLRFYSYVVSRLFENIKFYELRLIFIKHPQSPQIVKVDIKEFEMMKKEIKTMVSAIRDGQYIKNLKHCTYCNYSMRNNLCIKL
jgi:ATP-dependent helicase/nuclease subunit A